MQNKQAHHVGVFLLELNAFLTNLAVTSIYRQISNTRAKRLRMRKVSIFKLAIANANFTTTMSVFELKWNFISIRNFKAGHVKPPGMHWSKDF